MGRAPGGIGVLQSQRRIHGFLHKRKKRPTRGRLYFFEIQLAYVFGEFRTLGTLRFYPTIEDDFGRHHSFIVAGAAEVLCRAALDRAGVDARPYTSIAEYSVPKTQKPPAFASGFELIAKG
jgi:hypothetical protein